MSKSNFFVKFIKNINISINSLLEKNLNKLNFNNLTNLIKNNKIILTFVAVFIFSVSYLLLPTFYKQNELINSLQTKLTNKLNLQFNFESDLKYNFFPIPHFTSSQSFIKDKNKKISNIKNLKIYISLENLFSIKNIMIKKIVVQDANFELNKDNYYFFLKLLNNNYTDTNFKIKDSNIFFRNSEKDILFINKISNMEYYFDTKEIKNKIISKNEIFNLPYEIEIFKDNDEKKFLTNINLNFLQIRVENELMSYKNSKIGNAAVKYKKVRSSVDYRLEKNFLEFKFFDKSDKKKFLYDGFFNFKPFYSYLNGNADELNVSELFNSNFLVAQMLKSRILNNKNIDFKLNLKAKNIYPLSNFNNLILNSKIEEGLIDLDNSEINWKNFAKIRISDSLVLNRDGELFLDGKLNIKISDYMEIYKFLLTPKNLRNEIKIIDLNFSYNFDQKIINFSDIKIDKKYNDKINKIVNNIILQENNLQNKIYFKNLLNEAIKNYSG